MEGGTIELRDTNTWGGLLVVATDKFGTRTHHWFDVEGADAIHCQEVIYFGDDRYIVPEDKMMIPPAVEEKVKNEGYRVKEL